MHTFSVLVDIEVVSALTVRGVWVDADTEAQWQQAATAHCAMAVHRMRWG